MIGPFQEPHISLNFSPCMASEKSGSHLRITDFQLHHPSVDSILQHLIFFGPGANIFKIDIGHAFRHTRIDPGDIDLSGLTHKGKIFVDLLLPFRFRLGSFFSQKLSDTICYIMTKNGNNALLNYIDD